MIDDRMMTLSEFNEILELLTKSDKNVAQVHPAFDGVSGMYYHVSFVEILGHRIYKTFNYNDNSERLFNRIKEWLKEVK